ncbi:MULTISPECIES: glycoside hydrolase family 88 protein [Sphingobacterium]|uniref:Glucuronyl hydrolase n=2 Tax=Sphingobacterium TaxID=28453 RepID=A0A654BNA3_SPHMU|nr:MULTISPECIES: glycoside hydrolase family 88 protein [Sphingobacterium]HAK28746.1 glucuronyl hydrolase [Sphingobacterium sp.]QQT43894.1 glycoside hydrolase family 88 protein [Sphingobacterium multivorum]QQT63353.1 glycoside hydrolase family 88 protein [Sphingobacterium multivorum]SUJ06960.1 Unsaturated glucuronyl hydrolase [Sphingobacterium multivorum]VXC81961.1 Glucuronyl hydrolase [Sphingobacterium multivorum]
MKLKQLSVLLLAVLGTSTVVQAQTAKPNLSKEFIQQQLDAAAKQIKVLANETPAEKFPKTFENGKEVFSSSSWWCSGFYPGTLLYLYEGTKDEGLLKKATEKLTYLEKEKNTKGTHDLGFMLFCSFGNALRLTGDTQKYEPILSTGANSLASRYSPVTKTIRSWDHGSWQYPVIIDNMMNLEFLTQVSKMTGDKKFYDIAVAHAETTLKNHFRKDYSSYHVIDYDKKTGKAIGKKTHQGAFDESAWSRGQGWALYGYTMMYRETKKKEFLKQAQQIAKYILSNPNMPADLVPYWDFDKDKIAQSDKMYPNKDLRDVSAAALYASALLELSQYTKGSEAVNYFNKAEIILKNLSKAPYLAPYGQNGGYILQHSVGALPLNSEIDVPLTYADYYYVEALVRYQRLLSGEPMIKEIAK